MVQDGNRDLVASGLLRGRLRFVASPESQRQRREHLGSRALGGRLLAGDLSAPAQTHVGLCVWA